MNGFPLNSESPKIRDSTTFQRIGYPTFHSNNKRNIYKIELYLYFYIYLYLDIFTYIYVCIFVCLYIYEYIDVYLI